jgi:hypothetical protein
MDRRCRVYRPGSMDVGRSRVALVRVPAVLKDRNCVAVVVSVVMPIAAPPWFIQAKAYTATVPETDARWARMVPPWLWPCSRDLFSRRLRRSRRAGRGARTDRRSRDRRSRDRRSRAGRGARADRRSRNRLSTLSRRSALDGRSALSEGTGGGGQQSSNRKHRTNQRAHDIFLLPIASTTTPTCVFDLNHCSVAPCPRPRSRRVRGDGVDAKIGG